MQIKYNLNAKFMKFNTKLYCKTARDVSGDRAKSLMLNRLSEQAADAHKGGWGPPVMVSEGNTGIGACSRLKHTL